MLISELRSKRIAVWGCGREGKAVFRFLKAAGLSAPALCSEEASSLDELSNFEVKEIFTDPSRLTEFDIVIKSPGVSLYRPEIDAAKQAGVRFTSATNLALAGLDLKRVIAVTGTKGKSTTSSLLAHLLRGLGKSVVLAGNIGIPLLESINEEATPDYYVVELSSYQIADLEYFPRTAVLTNLYRDHITWHKTLEKYRADKLRLFQAEGVTAVLNAADELSDPFAKTLHNPVFWYNHPDALHVRDGMFVDGEKTLFPVSLLQLPGAHNTLNVLAALAVCSMLNLPIESAGPVLASFQPLPHRLTILGEKMGVTYVDDSISTVPETAIAALKCFPQKSVTLLLGGLDRGQDWKSFAHAVQKLEPYAILTIPDNGKQIASALRDLELPTKLIECETLNEAVACAEKITPQGGVVLLSPASASFPRFSNFEERGNTFAAAAGFPKAG